MKTSTTLTPVAGLAAYALAQDNTLSDGLKKLDGNGDGKITREEMPRLFDAIDSNKDGVASQDELREYSAKNPPAPRAADNNNPGAAPGTTAPAAAVRRELPEDVEKRAVTIWSDGTRMAGDLYLPRNRKADQKLPALLLCAGTGGTKNGTQARIASIFAQHGYIMLAFDYRGWGESDPKLMALEKIPPLDEKDEVTAKARAVRWQMDFAKLMASPWKFSRHGQSGLEFSELLAEMAKLADELCVIRSMQTDLPAQLQDREQAPRWLRQDYPVRRARQF